MSLSSGFWGMLEIYNIIYDEDNKVKHWLNMFKNEYTSVNSLRTGGWKKNKKLQVFTMD